jgi:isoprenylcysteine carboxyl methyltransferase (ICMT) family protein YpbQ
MAVAGQRLLELRRSRRHERALRARGGGRARRRALPGDGRPAHCMAAGTAVEGWRRSRNATPTTSGVAALVVFAAMQPLRWWMIRSLGDRWTTRVLTVPGEPLIVAGPYRWVRHPNYVVVAVEIATLAARARRAPNRRRGLARQRRPAAAPDRWSRTGRSTGHASPSRVTGTERAMGDRTDQRR